MLSVLSMENTLLYMGDGGAVKLFWGGGEWPRKTRRVARAGHAEGSECVEASRSGFRS